MNIAQIETNLQHLIDDFNKESFIFDLLLAYGTPKSTIARLQQSSASMFGGLGEDVVIKKKVFFREVDNSNLANELESLKIIEKVKKQDPRFIVVTDYETLLAYDTKTTESLDILLMEITQSLDFFLPWAGMEKHKGVEEQEADVKAAERMAKLYDEITKENPTQTHEEVHNLNVFLSRLLFCFFAEDTGIFEENQFSLAIKNHTQEDGSDLNTYLDGLFRVLNTPNAKRGGDGGGVGGGRDAMHGVSRDGGKDAMHGVSTEIPTYLASFPYVNGGLFRNQHSVPVFTQRSRRMLLDCGLNLQWRDINPDIFGSMIQAVITPEHRGGLGMHYTSVPNIMKVIEPLFLNELRDEFDTIVETRHATSLNIGQTTSVQTRHATSLQTRHATALRQLLKRIWNIKIFDPACGSGNFLIIAYKELRKLEMDIFNELGTFAFSEISLSNFYGIELDDFAHEVATLSLWLAEHQMNQIFRARFGDAKPALPLQETGNIVQGNACRIDWETVCPKNVVTEQGRSELAEVYILGNPPYLGSSMQSAEQKDDMALVCKGFENYKNLDYIACWFVKGAQFIAGGNAQFAFVSTNSICQGEQVALLWPKIFEKDLEISFAHTSFKWINNAKANAAVIVIIVGILNKNHQKNKFIFSEGRIQLVKNINAYLAQGNNIIIKKQNKPISILPDMTYGNKAVDGGNLILDEQAKNEILSNDSNASKFIRPLLGSYEFINGAMRYCLWIDTSFAAEAMLINIINNRIKNTKDFRLKSIDEGARKLSEKPYQFRDFLCSKTQSIIIPRVSSERRKYIPIGFLNSDTIILDSAQAIYDADPWIFAVINSQIHMNWVCVVAGRLKSDYRYSSQLCYNTFPFPPISDKQKKELEQHVYNILAEREKHSEKTLAQLYDPDKMPDGLREAHRLNDLAVERCYRSKPFENDEERLEYLFKLYETMIAEEKEKGTLFETEKKSKKKTLKGAKE